MTVPQSIKSTGANCGNRGKAHACPSAPVYPLKGVILGQNWGGFGMGVGDCGRPGQSLC